MSPDPAIFTCRLFILRMVPLEWMSHFTDILVRIWCGTNAPNTFFSFIIMEIWVNKVGGDLDSEFKIQVIEGIRDVNDIRKAINQSVECAKASERFGVGAVDIYTDASATAEFKLSARDTLFVDGQLKWTLLFFTQPAQPAGKTTIVHSHSSFFA